MGIPEEQISKPPDPLLARLAELEEQKRKIESETLAILKSIAAALGAPVTPIIAPLAPRPTGMPIAIVDRYAGNDVEYKTVASYTVTKDRTFEIKEISMVTSDYNKTMFKLTIAGDIKFQDVQIQAPLTLVWNTNEVEANKTILLECKSTDGTSLTVDGSITGREV